MPKSPDSMSVADATMALLLLSEWTPPEGVMVTVSCSRLADAPDRRAVQVTMSANGDDVCVVTVSTVPEAHHLATLTKVAGELLLAAWDEPACVGLGPGPLTPLGEKIVGGLAEFRDNLDCPRGPLNLKAAPHPVYDTSKMGFDS